MPHQKCIVFPLSGSGPGRGSPASDREASQAEASQRAYRAIVYLRAHYVVNGLRSMAQEVAQQFWIMHDACRDEGEGLTQDKLGLPYMRTLPGMNAASVGLIGMVKPHGHLCRHIDPPSHA